MRALFWLGNGVTQTFGQEEAVTYGFPNMEYNNASLWRYIHDDVMSIAKS